MISNGRLSRKDELTTRWSCCTGLSIIWLPFPPAHHICCFHLMIPPGAINSNSDNSTAEFKPTNTASSRVWSAYGMLSRLQLYRPSPLRSSGADSNRCPSANMVVAIFTCTSSVFSTFFGMHSSWILCSRTRAPLHLHSVRHYSEVFFLRGHVLHGR